MQPRLDYGIIAENDTRNGAIMRPTQFSADTIIALLGNQTITSLAEVMAALGAGASRRTAFRKLKDIDARTSYSHRGGYYTLDQLAHFDECGLWSFAGVRFSRAGTLLATAESFVNHAEAGHFVDELDNLLGIDPSTVAAGRRQLVERDVEVDRVRRAGGGRTPTEKGTIPTPTRCRSWPTARSRSSATNSSPTSPRPTSCRSSRPSGTTSPRRRGVCGNASAPS